jgi:hypothetical protein
MHPDQMTLGLAMLVHTAVAIWVLLVFLRRFLALPGAHFGGGAVLLQIAVAGGCAAALLLAAPWLVFAAIPLPVWMLSGSLFRAARRKSDSITAGDVAMGVFYGLLAWFAAAVLMIVVACLACL